MRRRYGWLGLEMALAFVAVGLVAVVAVAVVGSLIEGPGIDHLVASEEQRTAEGAARAAAAIYQPVHWAARLTPEIVLIDVSGSRMQCRNAHGQVVRSSPGYSGFGGPALTESVLVDGHRIGSVTVKFGNNGIAGSEQLYRSQRWEYVSSPAYSRSSSHCSCPWSLVH